jgi:hypothetical protein
MRHATTRGRGGGGPCAGRRESFGRLMQSSGWRIVVACACGGWGGGGGGGGLHARRSVGWHAGCFKRPFPCMPSLRGVHNTRENCFASVPFLTAGRGERQPAWQACRFPRCARSNAGGAAPSLLNSMHRWPITAASSPESGWCTCTRAGCVHGRVGGVTSCMTCTGKDFLHVL